MSTDPADDLARPELTDPALLAAAGLINAARTGGLLRRRSRRVRLAEPGGAADLARARPVPCPGRRGGPRGVRRCGAAGRLRRRVPRAAADPGGWVRPAATSPTPHRRASCSLSTGWWFEPLEHAVHEAQRAREGLLAGGDLANAAYTLPTDCVSICWTARRRWTTSSPRSRPGWPSCAVPATSMLGQRLDSYRWLADVLRGEAPAAEEAARRPRTGNPLALSIAHFDRAMAAAIFGDPGRPGAPHRSGDAVAAGRRGSLPGRRGARCCAGWPWPGRPAPPR